MLRFSKCVEVSGAVRSPVHQDAAYNQDIGDVRRLFLVFRSGYRTEGFGFSSVGTGITNAEFAVDYFRSRAPTAPPPDTVLVIR